MLPHHRAIGCISLALCLGWGPGERPLAKTPSWHETGLPAIRGVNVGPIESSQQPGRGYGTPYSAELLDAMHNLGANWIAITPFGRVWSLRSTEIVMDFETPFEKNVEAVRKMVRQAHARGLRVLVKPHLWIETRGWRGDIDPGTQRGWNELLESYRSFILTWAKVAASAQADAFSIGVENKSMSYRFMPWWDALIAHARKTFPGYLTYSANWWEEVYQVGFWDKLDWIGIDAFYKLAEQPGATYAQYVEGARNARDQIAHLAHAVGRPVVFTELGYTNRKDAAVEPWLWPDHMDNVTLDEKEQARAYRAMLEAFAPEPWFGGIFVWRYYANLHDVSQEAPWGFSPYAKQAEHVLREAFARRWGADPSPWAWQRHPRPQALPDWKRSAYPYTGLFNLPGSNQNILSSVPPRSP